MPEAECAGERSKGEAALRIGGGAEIVGDQAQLVVAAGFVDEAVEQFGEAIHIKVAMFGDRTASHASALEATRPHPAFIL